MQIYVTTTKHRYIKSYKKDLDQKLKLEELGFIFVEFKSPHGIEGEYYTIDCHPILIELESLKDLYEFADKWGELVIRAGDDGDLDIEIYNDYRE